jgi:ribonuclease HII
MLVLGADENGMGPRLGPLIASSVTLEISAYRRAALCERGLGLGLTDSKQTGGFGRMALLESVALALVEAAHGSRPDCVDALLDCVAPSLRAALQTRCPDASTAAQCWSVNPRLPVFGGDLAEGARLVEALRGRSSLRIVDVQSRLVCAGLLNERKARGQNKLEVDLALFEELVSHAAERYAGGGPLLAICGMVGGIRDYQARFSRFAAEQVQPLPSRRGQRRYQLGSVAELRFEIGADARHLPVALASMLGKYVRELSMRRIGDFYRRQVPELPRASGYHDPVTSRFIEATEPDRKRLGIAADCFRRRA